MKHKTELIKNITGQFLNFFINRTKGDEKFLYLAPTNKNSLTIKLF